MSKFKLISTNRERFMHQKTQQFSPYELKSDRKNSQKNRQLLLPIQKFPTRKEFNSRKPIRSQGKSAQKDYKMPAVDLFSMKQSLLIKSQRQSLHIKSIPKKKPSNNRMLTEKISYQNYSIQKKQSIANRILIRGGGFSKELSPERIPANKVENEKIWVTQKQNDKTENKDSRKQSLEKKLTAFQRDQSLEYDIFYIGQRRIYNKSDFTDSEGDSKVVIGDSIAYRYQIISQLGRGSFGRVFKAFDHKKKEHVALKIIKNQQKFTTQAKVQVQILQTAIMHDPKLRCNVVRLKGSFSFRGHSCLKFQILHKNLYEFIKDSNFAGFSLDLIRRFAIQILQALLFFHQFKIIHCDLKPENILLKEQNKSGIKVIDVGSGCFQNKQIYTYIQSRFYRAPQIILGIKYSAAIDMWSFGCILVQLYTGVPIFPGETENEQMIMFMQVLGVPPVDMLNRAERRKKFFNDNYQCKIIQPKGKQKLPKSLPWSDIIGECDPLFVDLVKKCLEWDPQKRITPKQALLHEWIISGLPQTIRMQHIEQVNSES